MKTFLILIGNWKKYNHRQTHVKLSSLSIPHLSNGWFEYMVGKQSATCNARVIFALVWRLHRPLCVSRITPPEISSLFLLGTRSFLLKRCLNPFENIQQFKVYILQLFPQRLLRKFLQGLTQNFLKSFSPDDLKKIVCVFSGNISRILPQDPTKDFSEMFKSISTSNP